MLAKLGRPGSPSSANVRLHRLACRICQSDTYSRMMMMGSEGGTSQVFTMNHVAVDVIIYLFRETWMSGFIIMLHANVWAVTQSVGRSRGDTIAMNQLNVCRSRKRPPFRGGFGWGLTVCIPRYRDTSGVELAATNVCYVDF